MIDQFGRTIEYLRISVTDRCNLRCRYCMPEEGVEHIGHEEILNFDEILKLVKVFSSKGIRRIKITGGEPLVRKDAAKLIRWLKETDGIEEVTMTSNGVLLGQYLPELLAAGLDGMNISLDTLDADKYQKLTGFYCHQEVLDNIDACLNTGKLKVKVNVVTLADINYDEVEALAAMAKDRNLSVRFIEMMPLGLGRTFSGFSQDEILDRLQKAYGPAVQSGGVYGNGPAVYYDFPAFKGKVGFISPMSHQFCESCSRIRLTSEGYLKTCLQYDDGADLRALLRSGASDRELDARIEKAVWNKPAKHCFLNEKNSAGGALMWEVGG